MQFNVLPLLSEDFSADSCLALSHLIFESKDFRFPFSIRNIAFNYLVREM